jgi:hypothetical protein
MSTINELLGFDPSETEAATSLEGRQEPIPNGRYRAAATAAKRKENKKRDGWFWEFTFTIIEGEFEGRTVIYRFNMANPKAQAVAIGRSQLKRYLEVIGNLEPQDENDMLGVAVWITVTCKKSSYSNKEGKPVEGINNEITQVEADSVSDEPKQKPKEAPPREAPSHLKRCGYGTRW